jgi:peptidoglycan/LPS O-acetylase OafA/YrhL
MPHRDLFTLLFGLHLIWTGLWRSIQAAAYKPNSLWFCLIIGLVAIVAGFLYRKRLERAASITAFCAAAIIFTFYFREFITQPEKDATFRVGLIILSSIAQLVVIFLPLKRERA